MRSAKIHSIDESPKHCSAEELAYYAEPSLRNDLLHNQSIPRFYWEHTKDGPVERALRQDKSEPWQLVISLICVAMLALVWARPWVERIFR